MPESDISNAECPERFFTETVSLNLQFDFVNFLMNYFTIRSNYDVPCIYVLALIFMSISKPERFSIFL